MAVKYCPKCTKTLKESEFYQTRDKKKVDLCKRCLTMHVNIYKPDTVSWIIKMLDFPWVPAEFNTLRESAYAKDPTNMDPKPLIGKYISKMHLSQYKDKGWADSEELQKRLESVQKNKATFEVLPRIDEEEYRRLYEAGEISEAEYRTMTSSEVQQIVAEETPPPPPTPPQNVIGENNQFNEDNFIDEDLIDLGKDLTDDDKVYLALKWGRLYKPTEWVSLEQIYTNMKESFDIQDADTEATLILLCKTTLKMNQAIDCGDLDGYQKLSKTYDALRRSAKFTAAQKKEKDEQIFDCVGQLVLFCEKEGGKIDRYPTTIATDKADEVLQQIKESNAAFIENDPTLTRQVEEYIKKLDADLESSIAKSIAKKYGLDIEIKDEDLLEFNNKVAAEAEEEFEDEPSINIED